MAQHIPEGPDFLTPLAKLLQDIRAEVLFEHDGDGLSPLAQQHLLLALSAIETAAHHAALADLHEAAALGARRR